MPTRIKNSRYADIGLVNVSFSDGSVMPVNITTLNTYEIDSTTVRHPVSINVVGMDYPIAQMPLPLHYPNATIGTVNHASVAPHVWIIYMDETAS